MKKRFLTMLAIVSFFTVGVFAQIQQGNLMIGGGAGFTTGEKATDIALSPKIGYFAIDRLAVGASLGVGYSKVNDLKESSFGIGPFARYYLTDGTPLKVFGQGSFEFASIKSGSIKTKGNQIGLGIGASYFLSEFVAIDAIFGYNGIKIEDSDRGNTFGLSLGVQAFFGGSSK